MKAMLHCPFPQVQNVRMLFGFIFAVLLGLSVQLDAQDQRSVLDFVRKYQQGEQIRDAYVPPNVDRTSPAYQHRVGSFFITQVNVSARGANIRGDAANEPSLAINPLDPTQIAIGWRQFNDVNSNFREAGYAVTGDGGAIWSVRKSIQPGVFHSDPVLVSDKHGRFYYNALGVNESSGNTVSLFCEVFRSTSFGEWSAPTYAYGGDKQWMTVDNLSDPPGLYTYWSSFSICEGKFTSSEDGGESFDECSFLIDRSLRWGTMDTGPEGRIYLSGVDSLGRFKVLRARKTGSDRPLLFDLNATVDLGGSLHPNHPVNPAGLSGQVEMAVDRSGSPTNGNIYLLASVTGNPSEFLDVAFASSSDGGLTWSKPIVINDDRSGISIHWFGTLSVAPDGRIDVAWLDTRDAVPGSRLSSLYHSASYDGGLTWTVNQRLSESFDPHVGWPQQNKMGDYFDMESTIEGAHLAFAATFNDEQDVYYAFIPAEDPTVQSYSVQDLDIRISPNPVEDMLVVEGKHLRPLEIDLLDVHGRSIQHEVTSLPFKTHLGWLPHGLYFVRIHDPRDQSTLVQKWIKN